MNRNAQEILFRPEAIYDLMLLIKITRVVFLEIDNVIIKLIWKNKPKKKKVNRKILKKMSEERISSPARC